MLIPWGWVTCWPTTPIQAASWWGSTSTGLGAPFGLDGRWMHRWIHPFDVGPTNFTTSCLGTFDTTHPLMQGISAGSLCAFFRHNLPLSSGAASVALYQDSQQLVAYKVNSGHTGVGINAYLGANPENFSGPFGRVIVNAGGWLLNCQGSPTPTPTGTPSPTPTPDVHSRMAD